MKKSSLLSLGFIWLLTVAGYGQTFLPPDSLVQQFYSILSGPPGERDWTAYRSMFHERAIQGTVVSDSDGRTSYVSFTTEGYIARNADFFMTRTFTIEQIHVTAVQFGGLQHTFSTYRYQVEGKDQNEPVLGRGINSFQFIYERGRWWIISLQWTNEQPGLSLPPELGG